MARSFDALIAERGLHNTTKHKICGIWCWKPCGNGAQSHMEYSAGDHGRACSHGCSNRFRDTPTIRRSRPHINQGRTPVKAAHRPRSNTNPDRTPVQTAHRSRPVQFGRRPRSRTNQGRTPVHWATGASSLFTLAALNELGHVKALVRRLTPVASRERRPSSRRRWPTAMPRKAARWFRRASGRERTKV